ncbi:MAG: ferredoxin [Proteobacteria bacterium]|nr:ferredoxin [Pseudomonadota bacterium]
MNRPKIQIDQDACIGAENCLRYAPATFETDERGKARTRDGDWDPVESIRIAVESCPMGALALQEVENGGRA